MSKKRKISESEDNVKRRVQITADDLLEQREQLPIFKHKKAIQEILVSNQVVILVGETGSGKTTQVPQYLVDFGYARDNMMIACTQPRRVAAMSVANRVAQEMGCQIGNEVGYSIRFEEVSSERTVLKYMTDGMLLREAMTDSLLSRYDVLIIDEAHERTLATDILLGLIKEVIPKRPSLKVIVMSATLDAANFQNYFKDLFKEKEPPLLKVSGRLFPVDIHYNREPCDNYLEAAIKTTLDIVKLKSKGDILVFLTGEDEIESACHRIEAGCRKQPDSGLVRVLPLYSSLPPQQQQKVFESAPGRKIVVATNIAETSITIDGIVYVVDPGFCKQKFYCPRTRVDSLLVTPISKASAMQRAGRAGRTQKGVCYRLYKEESFNDLIEQTYPEILRSNISSVVLTLKKIGIEDIVHFDFMSPPSPEAMMRALEILHYLGALNDDGDLTDDGVKMATFPLDPQLSKVLLESPRFDCSNEIVTIVSLLSVPPILLRPADARAQAQERHAAFAHTDGDHLSLLNIFFAWIDAKKDKDWCWENYVSNRALRSADNVRSQLIRIMKRLDIPLKSLQNNSKKYYENIRKALFIGFFTQVAHKARAGHYQTIKDQQVVALHPSCSLTSLPEWCIYNEFVITTKNFIRTVTKIKGEWLLELAPQYCDLENFPPGPTKKALLDIKRRIDGSSQLK